MLPQSILSRVSSLKVTSENWSSGFRFSMNFLVAYLIEPHSRRTLPLMSRTSAIRVGTPSCENVKDFLLLAVFENRGTSSEAMPL